MENWLNSENTDNNMVITTRIRLARNIKGIPFPDKLSDDSGRDVVKKITDALNIPEEDKKNFTCINLWKNDNNCNAEFLEKHLISRKLIENHNRSAFILNKDETISIMINEEDHLRLQAITAGLNLEEAYKCIDEIDDKLEQNINYAFDEKIGYLTACPTNIGTGMRASVMVHLPALSMNNEMGRILNALSQIGITIRGLWGEGSKAVGSLYQISNQITLGMSENDIISNLKTVVEQIINQENLSREQLMKKYEYELKDKIARSLGILKNSIILDINECLNLISNVRMGVEMGIIKSISIKSLNKLLVNTQRATLQDNYGKQLSKKEENIKRALFVRENLR
ncbi:protein arginine kinase [Clostridium felsineum]|uniref:Protein-arginine kinase n=1 Tax=Clostridium felsineum TaxID=36839 RepID=A0A1S8KXK6_9CLOT|nr:protein arginine kinase [Clostridium felsineum]MCR3758083.1 protein arginine kinase [Clostridium felsineum]URZ03402.1 Protein-arginine kinase [Clostridium felsineum]URZ08280.1 Protein-arginine kinase [Clostridium felsineum]URZ13311.1 Protein-arginine kinase [Clostridium felsineum]